MRQYKRRAGSQGRETLTPAALGAGGFAQGGGHAPPGAPIQAARAARSGMLDHPSGALTSGRHLASVRYGLRLATRRSCARVARRSDGWGGGTDATRRPRRPRTRGTRTGTRTAAGRRRRHEAPRQTVPGAGPSAAAPRSTGVSRLRGVAGAEWGAATLGPPRHAVGLRPWRWWYGLRVAGGHAIGSSA